MQLSRREAALAAVGLATLALPVAAKDNEDSVASLRALLKAHDKAFTAQDLDGVMATFHPDAVVMGTGHGELWIGHDELKIAYEQMFKDFDKGKQSIESLWHDGGVGPEGAWLMSLCNVKTSKGKDSNEFGINISMTCVHKDGKWLIRALHVSNPTGKG